MNSGSLERYRAEATDVLDVILTHSRDCIKLLTIGGELEYVSASARNALGLTDNSEAIGRAWRSFWPESERAKLDGAVISAAAGISARFDGATPGADGAARFWEVTVSPVRGGDRLITHLLAVSTDVTAQMAAAEDSRRELERAGEQMGFARSVSRELGHRLKNQLAVVGAVAKLLARHTGDAKELTRKLDDKLYALARAQDLLNFHRDEPIGAREAVEQVLDASGAVELIEIGELPDDPLPDESVQQLALILGELQTNALKHGALCDFGGQDRLSGETDGGVLTLRWREECGHPVTPVEDGGGGFQLIKRLGSAGGWHPVSGWHNNGIVVEFHARTAA